MSETIRIDLHCHSSASDGDHSPAHVARRLADIDVTWASLTDHNTVGGQSEFRAALAQHGIGYIPGVEIDGRSPFGPLHLLGYVIDLDNAPLLAALRTCGSRGGHRLVVGSIGCAPRVETPNRSRRPARRPKRTAGRKAR